ncbi:sensor histidine kinase [Cohnella terricola]|uniref:histidine kinase n=1 Tax=Cohnella terricola TaxID=1289167 RepID=A0A559JNH2_9BACL|nr:sensor histidine kinase [Cohnella terricola]TVY01429.1 sensor histidine kinase [Cohnella terricola]
MRLGKIYRNYIRNNLFIKVIFVFAIIVNVTIITLSYLLSNLLSANVVGGELNNQKQAMDRVNRYVEQKYDWLQDTVQEIYRNGVLASNISYFLTHPYKDYVKYMLDQNYEGGSTTDILNYFSGRMESDPDIQNVILYSSGMQSMYVFESQGQRKLYDTNATYSYIPEIMAMGGSGASTPNIWIRKTIDQWNPQLYAMGSQLNDKNSLQNIGRLLVYFDAGMASRALEQERREMKGTILVLTPDGQVLMDSSNRYYGETFPYMEQIQSLREVETLDEPSYISSLTQNKAGFTVVGIMPIREAAQAYAGLQKMIVLVSAACIAVAVVIPSLVIVSIARRTNKIVLFMKKVEGGNLTARLHDPREDELGQISRSFNEMLDELNRRIDREYKSEIRLKQTELSALQAKVNPHFLYNTLEVIRMRAMSHGAEDVGEMIYSLAALFRNSIRSNPECSLREELEMCRLYLELFRIRYKDKFSYSIEYDKELANVTIFKMLLQPVVENYIVHGLDPERRDNRLTIEVFGSGGYIRATMRDNGKGIEPGRLERLLRELETPEVREGESFGLRSVNDRLKLMFGQDYGVNVESEPGQGTTVTVSWPASGEGAKSSDV